MHLTAEEIARVAHAANRELQKILDNPSIPVAPQWIDFTDGERAGVIDGVDYFIGNPDASPAEMHENWVKDKLMAGWVWGKTKSVEAMTHPNLVPYGELPAEERMKDGLFTGIVRGLS